MTAGWIKLHRQFLASPYFTESAAVHVWVACLLRAAHETREFYLKRERIVLQPGQFVMGRKEFGASIGISGSTAWYWLLQFEADSMIDIRKTAKGSVVSVKNWSEYQQSDITPDKGKTADEPLIEPNKNDKKVKNDKKQPPVDFKTQSLYDFIDSECKQCGVQNDVNITALDIQVRRYQDLQLRVETRKCLTWLIEHGHKKITAVRLANWFTKAQEILKRDQLKHLEWQQAQKDPTVAARLKARGEKPEQAPEPFRIDPATKDRLSKLSNA